MFSKSKLGLKPTSAPNVTIPNSRRKRVGPIFCDFERQFQSIVVGVIDEAFRWVCGRYAEETDSVRDPHDGTSGLSWFFGIQNVTRN